MFKYSFLILLNERSKGIETIARDNYVYNLSLLQTLKMKSVFTSDSFFNPLQHMADYLAHGK